MDSEGDPPDSVASSCGAQAVEEEDEEQPQKKARLKYGAKSKISCGDRKKIDP